MLRLFTFLVLILLSFGASAQPQTVPTKTVSIHNNSKTETIYPVFQAPIRTSPNVVVHDLWMQALFDVKDVDTQVFPTTVLFTFFVNRNAGIPPGGSVTITVPFYTQLLAATSDNVGKVNDQYIDWWNAMRINLFDKEDAVTAVYNYNVDAGVTIPPIPVVPFNGAAVPTCTPARSACEPILIKAYKVGYPIWVPSQLVEYTFAAAQGPPLNPVLSINNAIVNYNISAVDSVYLPAAIGAHGNQTAANGYLGSVEPVSAFRLRLAAFTELGEQWPYYLPAFFDPAHATIPLETPPRGVKPYPQPQIPSTNVVYAGSFVDPPPAPPTLSSDRPGAIGVLGSLAQQTSDLWDKCTLTVGDNSTTCQKIRAVNEFFLNDFRQCFPGAPLPAKNDLLRDVYGWVQYPGCSTPLSSAPGYADTIKTYCDLQYNFFDKSVPADDIFNPYVRLVHVSLKSNAYAFSIDDAVSFKSLPGDGVIITVAGVGGLEDTNQTPLPTPATYKQYCR